MQQFDVIVVGSGPGGATVARELALRGCSVLVLERGRVAPTEESLFGVAAMLRGRRVGERMVAVSGFATGGSTSIYFGVASLPPLQEFLRLGVDIAAELDAARRELPVVPMPAELLSPQSRLLAECARKAGLDWAPQPMLLDPARCNGQPELRAKWNANAYLAQAVQRGAELVTRATVEKVLVEGGRAVGVEYTQRSGWNRRSPQRALGGCVIVVAGGGSSPLILRRSGVGRIVANGFYCHPTFVLFGRVPGLRGGPTFSGSMAAELGAGLSVADACLSPTFHRMAMIARLRWRQARRHAETVGIGASLREGASGALDGQGQFQKVIEPGDLQRLDAAEARARDVLARAGAQGVFRTKLAAAHIGGTAAIGDGVDSDLQTEVRGLYVCDGSVIPSALAASPTLPLVCLGKRLARMLDERRGAG